MKGRWWWWRGGKKGRRWEWELIWMRDEIFWEEEGGELGRGGGRIGEVFDG